MFLFFRIFTKTCLNCSASTEGPADKEATNFVKFLGLNAEWSSVMERWLEFFKELLEFWLFSEAFYNSTGLRGVSDLNLTVSFAPVRTIPQCAKASAAILNIFVSMFNNLERLLQVSTYVHTVHTAFFQDFKIGSRESKWKQGVSYALQGVLYIVMLDLAQPYSLFNSYT